MNTEINEVINNLCTKFGCALNDLTPELMRMIMVRDIGCIIIGAILIVSSVICFYFSFKEYNKQEEKWSRNDIVYYERGEYEGLFGAGSALLVFALLFLIPATINYFQWLTAPKAMTITYILDYMR